MAQLAFVLPHIIQWEGGYANNKNDKGGKTNRGVTLATFQRLAKPVLGIEPTLANHKTLTEAQAKRIMGYYWKGMMGEFIHDNMIAAMIMDWFFMSGGWCISRLIRILNKFYGHKFKDAGKSSIMSFELVKALNSIKDTAKLIDQIHQTQKDYYEAVIQYDPTQATFRKGWHNRMESLLKKKPKSKQQ